MNDLDVGLPITLVLRKWHEGHQKGMEFRVYVVGKKIKGINQKDETAYYECLADIKPVVFSKVTALVEKLITISLDF